MQFEKVSFKTSDGLTLYGWHIPGPSKTTLVWFHGNAGNISDRVANISEFQRNLGVNIFIFDYRGYGLSEGSPSEKGTYMDGDAAIKYITSLENTDPSRLVFFGRSLGCAVAAEMAIRHDVYALVLESGFTSIKAMASRAYPFLPGVGLLTDILLKTKYDTLSKLRQIHTPIMVLHGDKDETVPFDFGLELYEMANPPKRFHTIEGANHNDTFIVGGTEYFEALVSFLKKPARDVGQ